MDAEVAARDLVRAGVVIDLRQELLVVGGCGLRVDELAGGIVGGGDVRQHGQRDG